jgi:RNA-directed DNA polymerase
MPGGVLVKSEKGTPQGGVVSPLLANLFLHYAFDLWMRTNQPHIPFERYADDVICHCKSKAQAEWLLASIEKRLAECKLELNLRKTQIVYCKDDRRKGKYSRVKFDFLGFTFQPRLVKGPYVGIFVGFTPAISNKASKAIRDEIRLWRLHRRTQQSLEDFSRMYNPIIRGWVNYYGSFYKSKLYDVFNPLNLTLARWAMRKYKKLRGISAWQAVGFLDFASGRPICLRTGS